jgi:hypothetical protein
VRLIRLLGFRPVATTLVLLLLYATYQGFLWAAAGAKLPPTTNAAPAAYEIVLAFPPEAFHVTRLQAIGRVIEVKERSVFVRDVPPAEIRRFARNYWVETIRLWDAG